MAAQGHEHDRAAHSAAAHGGWGEREPDMPRVESHSGAAVDPVQHGHGERGGDAWSPQRHPAGPRRESANMLRAMLTTRPTASGIAPSFACVRRTTCSSGRRSAARTTRSTSASRASPRGLRRSGLRTRRGTTAARTSSTTTPLASMPSDVSFRTRLRRSETRSRLPASQSWLRYGITTPASRSATEMNKQRDDAAGVIVADQREGRWRCRGRCSGRACSDRRCRTGGRAD